MTDYEVSAFSWSLPTIDLFHPSNTNVYGRQRFSIVEGRGYANGYGKPTSWMGNVDMSPT